jgi:hypothetical protein
MASYGVEQDIDPNTTFTVNGVLQIAPPTQISTINTGTTVGSFLDSYQSISANSSGTQAGGTPITATGVVAVSSAASGYSVTLPPSVPGMSITIVLTTASNTAKVYPSGTDKINALAASAAITMSALTSASFNCVAAGQWWTSPRVPS